MNGDMGLTPNYGPGFLTLNAILSQVMEMRGGGAVFTPCRGGMD